MDWIDLITWDNRVVVQQTLSWILILAAFIWGGGPERAVAATWLICFKLVGFLRENLVGDEIQLVGIDFYWALSDLTAGVSWVVIALYANRNYTLGIAGLQVLAMTAHLARGMAEAVSPIGYVFMVAAPGWGQLLLLAIGLTRHILRKRKHGQYRDWRIQKPEIGSGTEATVLPGKKAWQQAEQPNWRDELK
ncbi:hypothetical protein [uncultured Erythrobacter sp.]|uniref:hypothetical protein n=1 Tax=uncultured Erythrobacter sp. TaxID=263913 RepID=UPI002628BA20|nr:hypothetical protein [uncultured Erythrobacter sp.]